jgi:hypothetical protein
MFRIILSVRHNIVMALNNVMGEGVICGVKAYEGACLRKESYQVWWITVELVLGWVWRLPC